MTNSKIPLSHTLPSTSRKAVQQPHIFIPMTVRALPVGKPSPNAHFSGFQYDMTKLGSVMENTETPLFADAPSETEPGIYLHWRLPACFTAGVQNPENGNILYRLAPNRFSVTRLWTDPEGALQSKTFLVESDVLSADRTPENRDSPSIPWKEDTKRPYRFQGRSFDAGRPSVSDPDQPFTRLTAVSPSSPFFAAYAPACGNVFSFTDHVADDGLSHGVLSYVVCGWYQEHGETEPCFLVTDPEQLKDTMGLVLDGGALPLRALCHGAVTGILWEGAEHVYPTGTPDDPESGQIVTLPKLGVGNTSAEAMAALLHPPTQKQERLLHHYLSDNARDLEHFRGPQAADEHIRQSRFYADPPVVLEGLQIQQGQEDTEYDPALWGQLRILRKKQFSLQQNQGRYLQKQRQIYEKWYLHYYADLPPEAARYRKEMEEAWKDAQKMAAALSAAQSEIVSLELQLKNQFSCSLRQESENAFYTPVDPVVVTAQAAPESAVKNQASSLLLCRSREQLITGLSFGQIPSLSHITLETSDLAVPRSLEKVSEACPEEDIYACVAECVFLCQDFSAYLAGLAYKKAGLTPSETQQNQLSSQIAFLQANQDGCFQGHFPDQSALARYSVSWSPLIVEWETSFYPDPDLLCPEPSLKNWALTRGDYVFQGDPQNLCTAGNAYPIGGRFFLSDNAAQRLTDTLRRLHAPDALLEKAQLMQYLSQTLDGFGSSLLMRDPSVNMDFFSKEEEEQNLLNRLQSLSPSVLADRPVFDGLFGPIRAGFFDLRKVRLIDEMGFYQDIDSPSVYAGENFLAPCYDNPVRYVMLPPRLVQPLTLSAFLADASGAEISESLLTPETSPVCGYLVTNYLNHSIMVYTALGVHACSISLTQTGAGILLQNAPLMPQTPVPPPDLDPQMTAFLLSLLQKGPKALSDLLSLLDQRQLMIRTGAHARCHTEYFGSPVAMFRLSLRLVLYGDPEGYRHVDGETMDVTCRTDITALSVPVQIGQPDDPQDGVYGFFENGDYNCFHSFPEVVSNSGYLQGNDQVALSLKPESPAEILTLLADPYGEIHLVTGILPVKTLRIPDRLTTSQLDALSVSYFSAPVLSGESLAGIPVPHSDSVAYSWCAVSRERNEPLRPLSPSDPTAVFPSEKLYLREGHIIATPKGGNDK